MGLWQAVVLGLVQGLTEFLPVSSSGHLVLAEALLGVGHTGILFEVAVHAATLLAVAVFYRRRLGELLAGALAGRSEAWRYGGKLLLASVPAGLAGTLGGEFFEAQFGRPEVAALCLLVTGAVVWSTRHTWSRARDPEPGWSAALWIGCAQAVAILPGISRSGATVAAALALGVAPLAAAAFSFLLSIPAILGAVGLELPSLQSAPAEALGATAVASGVALVAGLGALALFVRLLRGGSFHRFAYYVWLVGGLALLGRLLAG